MSTTTYSEKKYSDMRTQKEIFSEALRNIAIKYKNKAERRWDKSTNKVVKQGYHYIPQSNSCALQNLQIAKQNLKNKHRWYNFNHTFVDAGCGIGLICEFANQLGFLATGYDLDKENLNVAEQLGFKRYYTEFIKKDINKVNYGKFDVIYFYCPIKDTVSQRQFEEKVAKEMKVGAYVIPMGCGDVFRDNTISFTRLPNSVVYIKKKVK